ncbi:winged helix DNA-binding domain-containing protein [Cellulomonas aerilata]|uniref:Winged helix DNA-binding domain-containing protein n=1 Tax=Cellulomonas aerilata TaxID=515326 RepID=A0A512DD70_9CELL|nr:winged helix DNA-binding domain-containing protein [Cellulomonas aerilata]GEO34426.1 hypothetical protein CAE01nite_21510 [Cellulomonas aerilata]
MVPPARPDAPTLDRRSLGRALLARQHLLARHEGTVAEETAHLVGLQAQAPWAPYTGLWTRLAGFRHADLADRLLDRTVVRIAVMRGTIHLLVADDALVLPALCEPILRAGLRTNAWGPALRDVDLARLEAAARAVVEASPTATGPLGRRLAELWPDVDPTALAYAARGTLPLVQVPPRAVWGRSGATTWTTTGAWLGRDPVDLSDPDAHDAALDDLVLRYLRAFGPASVADVQLWSGLTRLAPVVERLRPRLVTFRAEPAPGSAPGSRGRGRELFDLPDAPRPDPGTPAPARLLPEYDNLLLSHADRTRVVDDDARRRLWRANGAVPGTLLVDGTVAGSWTVDRAARRATLTVEPFRRLTRAETADVRDEAEHLVRFVADEADTHAVVWHPDADLAPGATGRLRSPHDFGA